MEPVSTLLPVPCAEGEEHDMKQIITTLDQVQALRATQLASRDALNAVSQYAFAHGKTSRLVSARAMDVSFYHTRAMSSILRLSNMEPPLVVRNSGVTKQSKPSICSFL